MTCRHHLLPENLGSVASAQMPARSGRKSTKALGQQQLVFEAGKRQKLRGTEEAALLPSETPAPMPNGSADSTGSVGMDCQAAQQPQALEPGAADMPQPSAEAPEPLPNGSADKRESAGMDCQATQQPEALEPGAADMPQPSADTSAALPNGSADSGGSAGMHCQAAQQPEALEPGGANMPQPSADTSGALPNGSADGTRGMDTSQELLADPLADLSDCPQSPAFEEKPTAPIESSNAVAKDFA